MFCVFVYRVTDKFAPAIDISRLFQGSRLSCSYFTALTSQVQGGPAGAAPSHVTHIYENQHLPPPRPPFSSVLICLICNRGPSPSPSIALPRMLILRSMAGTTITILLKTRNGFIRWGLCPK